PVADPGGAVEDHVHPVERGAQGGGFLDVTPNEGDPGLFERGGFAVWADEGADAEGPPGARLGEGAADAARCARTQTRGGHHSDEGKVWVGHCFLRRRSRG